MASNPTTPRVVNRCARWTLGVLLPWALLVFPRAVRAEDKPPPKLPAFLRLEYAPGPLKNCPNRETLEDAIIAVAKRDPLNNVAPALLQVTIKRRGPFYVGLVEVRDKDGAAVWHRPWDAPLASCRELVDALGYLIGSALREDPPAPPAPPAPAPAKVEPAPSAPLTPVVPTPDQANLPPSPPRREAVRFNIGAAGALGIGTSGPLFSFNLMASAGLRWRSFSGALEFRWTPPEPAAVDTAGRELVHVMQYAGRVVPCGHFRALVYCGVGEVSAIVSKGALNDTMAASATALPSAATGVRIGADLPIPILGRRLVFRPAVDALVNVAEVRIRVVGVPGASTASTEWMTPRFSVFVGAGILTDLRLK